VEVLCRLAFLGMGVYLVPIWLLICLDLRDVIRRGYPDKAKRRSSRWSLTV